MENRCDFETTWVFPLLQFLWRQTDAQNSYLSNDIIVLAVACIKAPLLGKHGNSTLLPAQPVLKGIENIFYCMYEKSDHVFRGFASPPLLYE